MEGAFIFPDKSPNISFDHSPFHIGLQQICPLKFDFKPTFSRLLKRRHLSTRKIMAKSLLPMQHYQFGHFPKRNCCKNVICHPFHHALIDHTKYVTHFDGL